MRESQWIVSIVSLTDNKKSKGADFNRLQSDSFRTNRDFRREDRVLSLIVWCSCEAVFWWLLKKEKKKSCTEEDLYVNKRIFFTSQNYRLTTEGYTEIKV